jgi:hypothetical protein
VTGRQRPLFAPPPPTGGQLDERVERWAAHKVPAKTREAYDDWRDRYVLEYCPAHGITDPFDSDGQRLADFIGWLAETGTRERPGRPRQAYSPNSLEQAMYGVLRAHRDERRDAPDAAKAREVIDGYRRWMIDQDWEERHVDPLTVGQMTRVINALDLSKPRGLRDRALLLVLFRTFRRQSTAAAWNVRDVRQHEKGLILRVRQSKTDPTGRKDDYSTLEPGPLGLDPIAALNEWTGWLRRQPGGGDLGPLFRQMNRTGTGLYVHPRARSREALRGRLTTRSIRTIVEDRLTEGGVADEGDFTAHSLRAGGATDAYLAGWSYERICLQAGWSPTSNVARHYFRNVQRWAEAAVS